MLALERAGLLAIDAAGTPPAVWVSPALQAAVRAAAPPDLLNRAARAAADALAEVWPAGQPRSWLAAALRSSAASLRQATGDALWDAGGCHRLLLAAGHSLDAAGLTGPAVTWWRELAAGSHRLLGPGHPDTVLAGGLLAGALLAAGQAAEAVTWFRWVLAGRAEVLGPDHPGTIAAEVSLGRALVAAGQPGEAIPVLDQAARHSERVHGPDDAATLAARDQYAAACLAAGNLTEAIACYQRSLAGRERLARTGGSRHPDRPAAAGRRLPGRRQDQGRHRPAQEGPGRPGARPGRRSPGHAGGPRRAWPPPTTPPGRWATRCTCTRRRAPVTNASSAAITRTPWPAARTWRTPTPPPARPARR